ncbi:hypothetical protein B0H16DRAFT_1466720 [Mycena metata]|uniref:Uncharacterized protein n=1 Tax=Mycena metata TaxID=1033252 RepID=A0AAD7MXF3_9AGAR|nr:hypothetical protein B0H16DRAFT_1466720 [Mycena metata]
MHTVSFASRDSHFAEPEAPPPPVVQLLIHTDFATPPSTVLSIHEDFGSSTQKRVKFDEDMHPYPPLVNYAEQVPVPSHPSTKAVESHPGWDCEPRETQKIKNFIHGLVGRMLDESKSYKNQDDKSLAEVIRQATQQFPVLRKYEDAWGTRCILMSHLKNTTNKAAHKAAKDVVDTVTDIVQPVKKGKGKATNKATKEASSGRCLRSSDTALKLE